MIQRYGSRIDEFECRGAAAGGADDLPVLRGQFRAPLDEITATKDAVPAQVQTINIAASRAKVLGQLWRRDAIYHEDIAAVVRYADEISIGRERDGTSLRVILERIERRMQIVR